ncbi:MAG: thioredoxin domain-containing protein [Bacteroidetes bacterium B1(2017)]|nr:MAG: thioredoxin domain-containing protein [Bacteroidetes bacterium B1(2017)]
MSTHKYTNELIHASSPYLLQHAHNPVNWRMWSDDILLEAKREDKLLLISIGYSSCHWCHVMEHECFEKEDTAAIMNERFICVKIDREERPDIDQIYMDAVQLLTGRGGWPLNVFTLPDGRPLHGGTYFPKQEWERVLISLSNFYEDKREEAYEFATNLSNGIKKQDQFELGQPSNSRYPDLMELLAKWKLQFDLSWGGYNWSPKFPLPNQWELFMGVHSLGEDDIFKEATYKTLTKMYEGGIFDHLAGGFSRYSTDAFWKVPHFEKMLYDNAQLMSTYAQAYAYYKEPLFKEVVAKIHTFIQADLQSPEGGFYSALDADSEGVEGKYYVWSADELADILEDRAPLFCAYYSVEPSGNWEGENILYRTLSVSKMVELFNLSESKIESEIELCKKLLLLERSKRIAPGLDDKLICSWNALMVKGYAQAYTYCGEEAYKIAAIHSIDYLLSWCLEGKQVYRIQKDSTRSILGFAEDYACLIEALLAVFEATGLEKYAFIAKELMEECIHQFFDEATGLFFFSSAQQQVLITRKIEVNDDVIPASNSILAKCLYRLSYYFELEKYEHMSLQMVDRVFPKMQKFPNGYSNWMQLITWFEKGFTQVIVAGLEAQNWKLKLNQPYRLNTVVLVKQEESKLPLLREKPVSETQTTAWICTNKTCGLPIQSLAKLEEALIR